MVTVSLAFYHPIDFYVLQYVRADEDISLFPDGNTEIQTSINEANFEQTTFSMPEDNDLGGNDDFSSVLPEE